jgi:nicotinate-nucleotide adenylyltransferase
MGGTFDPIHFGHLLCAERAREAFVLDGVVFMPAGDPSFKAGRVHSSGRQRLAMTGIAIAGNPYFEVSALEVDRPGITYTVDTLTALRAHYPGNVDLYFITGADALETITQWHRCDELRHLARFIGVSRPGYSADIQPIVDSGFSVSLLEIEALAISSSDIRRRSFEGKTIRYLTPGPVVDYIGEQGLYE